MQINVSQLLKEPIGSSRNYEVSEIVDVTGDGSGRKVQGEVRLLRTHRGVLVKGELHAEVELTCSRCLSLFNFPVAINFEEEYLPTIDVVSGAPLPSPEEPGSFVIDEHHVIDLTEAIRQYTLLTMPMKPLCRQDCAGLCPDCGHNLNRGPCDYPPPAIDSRWSELTELL
ncbi:hypothetical protein ES703_53853 [subsurface metagenome]